MRGSGELLGTQQSGFGDLRALDPIRDLELLRRARDAARSARQERSGTRDRACSRSRRRARSTTTRASGWACRRRCSWRTPRAR
ncbi:MAG: hypothetical protein VYD05_15940 [Planctomycetota bacterium]|nr:hypothetical protein [Planctomycetota bacterium]